MKNYKTQHDIHQYFGSTETRYQFVTFQLRSKYQYGDNFVVRIIQNSVLTPKGHLQNIFRLGNLNTYSKSPRPIKGIQSSPNNVTNILRVRRKWTQHYSEELIKADETPLQCEYINKLSQILKDSVNSSFSEINPYLNSFRTK